LTGPTATYNGVMFSVPAGWQVRELSEQAPCPPSQSNFVVIAGSSVGGGDCIDSLPDQTAIYAGKVNPLESGPSTTGKLGKLDGWVHEETRAQRQRWVAVLPKQNVEIDFAGPIDERTRAFVIDSIRKAP
jgi:hypothetical protein